MEEGSPIGRAGLRAADYAARVQARHTQPLPSDVRARLGPALGFDPAVARLHTGAEADAAARSLDAEAFTIGEDVYFAEGRYDPATSRGVRLLAHELTHVRQQTGVGARPVAAREPSPHAGGQADEVLALHRDTQPVGPSMAFAMPAALPATASGPPPSETATQEQDSGAGGLRAGARADAGAVAERVYELMRREIELGRERGIVRRRTG